MGKTPVSEALIVPTSFPCTLWMAPNPPIIRWAVTRLSTGGCYFCAAMSCAATTGRSEGERASVVLKASNAETFIKCFAQASCDHSRHDAHAHLKRIGQFRTLNTAKSCCAYD